MVPALLRVMAHSPAVLDGYLAIQESLEAGSLHKRLRYQIALAVSQAAGSEYCVAAYTALGKSAGLSDEALRDARVASSPDRRTDTALKFARVLKKQSAREASDHLFRLRQAGFKESEIVEIVAHVMVVSLANALYHLSDVAVDFPSIELKDG
ncbi:MAG TPA: carboxymuconolactone decarboxylase family protein [Gammaproteobacteria bacterium]|nr:carboxymuconolactone decarboxylase family protein [Gammaproteobacteria bacterium]